MSIEDVGSNESPAALPSLTEALRAQIEEFIAKADAYRIHSEVIDGYSIQYALDMLHARDTLRALLLRDLSPAETKTEPNDAR